MLYIKFPSQFYDYDTYTKDSKMFWLWLNTSCIHDYYISLEKNECDGARKDKQVSRKNVA